jgi:hypothetical protein
VDSGVGASLGSGHRGDPGSHQDPQEEKQDGVMTETDRLILAAVMAVICLIGPRRHLADHQDCSGMARYHPATHMGVIGTTTIA